MVDLWICILDTYTQGMEQDILPSMGKYLIIVACFITCHITKYTKVKKHVMGAMLRLSNMVAYRKHDITDLAIVSQECSKKLENKIP